MFVSDHDVLNRGAATTADVDAMTGPLSDAVTGLLGLDVDDLSDADLAAAMTGLRRELSRLAAALADLTAAFDARRVWADDGSRSAIDWIAVHARLPRGLVAGEVPRRPPAARDACHPGRVARR